MLCCHVKCRSNVTLFRPFLGSQPAPSPAKRLCLLHCYLSCQAEIDNTARICSASFNSVLSATLRPYTRSSSKFCPIQASSSFLHKPGRRSAAGCAIRKSHAQRTSFLCTVCHQPTEQVRLVVSVPHNKGERDADLALPYCRSQNPFSTVRENTGSETCSSWMSGDVFWVTGKKHSLFSCGCCCCHICMPTSGHLPNDDAASWPSKTQPVCSLQSSTALTNSPLHRCLASKPSHAKGCQDTTQQIKSCPRGPVAQESKCILNGFATCRLVHQHNCMPCLHLLHISQNLLQGAFLEPV